ncbi:hypothetical protein KGM_211372 [Danaus plexippus plexippus]|uniref:Uncharacterized protein n=1 Tax=Danaus plexippus plexippus TaxID=278856 RepID=A0A212FDB9_DANPL|nr:hypothetical protein KGM_211372 [Danaus plexippus plexippus]
MKTTVLLVGCLLHITVANTKHELKVVDNHEKYKTYQLDVPGKEPITIIENKSLKEDPQSKWDIVETQENDDEIKNLMTHIIHDIHSDKPRCYGPSCQEGFVEDEGPQEHGDDYVLDNKDKLKDFNDYSNERMQAIAALAAKLKKLKNKSDRYSSASSQDYENDDKVYTSWNRLKVKQHKHPYDDKDGWVTLEPVAWSTSKVSKWKPNVKKQKPSYWNDNEDTKYSNDDRFQDSEDSYIYPQKRPTMTRPGYINNKLYMPQEFESELPSKPSWTKDKPQHNMQSFHSSWSSDDSRRPYKPNCDHSEDYPSEDSIYYGMSDSVVTDNRPPNFPFEYEALHQASSQKRPLRRPTQVVYADTPDYHSDHHSRPPYGDGQWVLLSTTKGYRNKKRQRSLSSSEENTDVPSITSHQTVSLTVLPVDENSQTNMTTSHGGMLEVEKTFQTVEEAKRDMDLKNELESSASQPRPVRKIVKKKLVGNKNSPDSSTVLAAVGAGMVPATMAMVVPMMLGRRRRRDLDYTPQILHIDDILRS